MERGDEKCGWTGEWALLASLSCPRFGPLPADVISERWQRIKPVFRENIFSSWRGNDFGGKGKWKCSRHRALVRAGAEFSVEMLERLGNEVGLLSPVVLAHIGELLLGPQAA